MGKKKIFSARYPEFDPEQWATAFKSSDADRSVLAKRLIKMARKISDHHEIGIDIFVSDTEVQIDLYLGVTVLYEDGMKALAALMRVCDSMDNQVWGDPPQHCISLLYDLV